jgi:hypothetical protein
VEPSEHDSRHLRQTGGKHVSISPFFLVLYVTLKDVDEGWALLALSLGLIGLWYSMVWSETDVQSDLVH